MLYEDCVLYKVYLGSHQAPRCSAVYTGDFKLPQMQFGLNFVLLRYYYTTLSLKPNNCRSISSQHAKMVTGRFVHVIKSNKKAGKHR